MGHVQDNAAESVAPRLAELCRMRAFELPRWTRAASSRSRSRSTAPARGDGRFHRHLAAARRQLQRARAGDAGRGALCVPRMVDDDIPMNAGCLRPIRDRHPAGLDAVAAISGRRGGRQCRDQPGRDRHAVRRARRAGGRAGHDEQPDLRQRPLPVLRDDLLGRAGRPRLRRAPTPSIPT